MIDDCSGYYFCCCQANIHFSSLCCILFCIPNHSNMAEYERPDTYWERRVLNCRQLCKINGIKIAIYRRKCKYQKWNTEKRVESLQLGHSLWFRERISCNISCQLSMDISFCFLVPRFLFWAGLTQKTQLIRYKLNKTNLITIYLQLLTQWRKAESKEYR